jgi:hypothetical protein
MPKINFQEINWENVPKVEYLGETGISIWQTIQYEGLRIRLVEYSKDFIADHWCEKGHIVHCINGEFECELKGKDTIIIKEGMSFIVSDNLSSHKAISKNGSKILIINGDFLR